MTAGRMFVGRERELNELENGLDDACAGRGRLFLLSGEAGIGKTRLCDELALRALDRGLPVRWGRCWEVGGAPPYWPWIQLLRAAMREGAPPALEYSTRELLARLLPELGGPATPALEHSAEQRFQLFDAVTRTLRRLTEQRPLVAILDDLHAADPSSLALLLFVARELQDLRLCLIGTYREEEARRSAATHEVFARIEREAQPLSLARLSAGEVRALLGARSELSGELSDSAVASVFATTEGLPLFVSELARARNATGRWQLPETIRVALAQRAAALPGAVRELVEAAAVLGRECSRSILAALLERPSATLQQPLSAALAAGVLVEPEPDVLAFSHALLRDAIYRQIAEPEREVLHARAADVLERAGASETALAETANHLLAARRRVGSDRALAGAVRAAERALSSSAYEDTVAILEGALATLGADTLDRRAHCEALLMLGEAQIRAGGAGAPTCQRAAALARELGDPSLLARAGLALGAEIRVAQVNPTLVALLNEGLRALPAGSSALRARVLARLAGAMQPARDPNEPLSLAREAIAMARALGDEATLRVVLHGAGSALVDYAPTEERLDVDRQTYELARAARDRALMFRAQLRLFFDYAESGAWQELDRALEACAGLSSELRRARARWHVEMLRAFRANLRGEFDAADGHVAAAREACAQDDDESLRVSHSFERFGRALLRHTHAELAAPLMPSSFDTQDLAENYRNTVDALRYARSGQHALARERVARLDVSSSTFRSELLAIHLLAETCVLSELREPAAVVLAELEPRRARFVSWGLFGLSIFGPITALTGPLQALLGRYDDAFASFEDAIARCRAAHARPALARVLYDCAHARLSRAEAGDADEAAHLLEQSAALAGELGMPDLQTWIARARARCEDARRPPPSSAMRVLATPDAHAGRPVSMEREGDVWSLTHAGRSFRLKHSRGLAMLAQLMEQPGREHHALALGEGGGAGELGDAGEAIDRRAAATYRERLTRLREQEQLAEELGDSERAEHARSEIDQIAQHLSAALGLAGKGRRAGSAAERARVNVQRRIKDALVRIGREDAELGRYLSLCVRTGTFSVFDPLPSKLPKR